MMTDYESIQKLYSLLIQRNETEEVELLRPIMDKIKSDGAVLISKMKNVSGETFISDGDKVIIYCTYDQVSAFILFKREYMKFPELTIVQKKSL